MHYFVTKLQGLNIVDSSCTKHASFLCDAKLYSLKFNQVSGRQLYSKYRFYFHTLLKVKTYYPNIYSIEELAKFYNTTKFMFTNNIAKMLTAILLYYKIN